MKKTTIAVATLNALIGTSAFATMEIHKEYKAKNADAKCDTCHMVKLPKKGAADLNDFGKTVKAAKPVEIKAVASTKKKAVTPSVASVDKKAVTSVEKKTASAASGMSCDKAGEIVSGYGFTSVKPTTRTGQVFAFNATRSGKAYVIKLSSASGELTEVKKVQ
jgi:hypothetical protein